MNQPSFTTPETCFEGWAPYDVEWAKWAKPVLFIQVSAVTEPLAGQIRGFAQAHLLPSSRRSTAVIVDLAGEQSLLAGLALAERGFRPVPLYNATMGAKPLVDVDKIVRWLPAGAAHLATLSIGREAPPAFLLDSHRLKGVATPGAYDNRWVVLPQDFPSATFLLSREIREVILVQADTSTPRKDLTHVLRRWQEAGIQILALDLEKGDDARSIDVPKPSGFRRAWYRVIALLGLRRSNVGGFGARVPEETSGGGYS
jgi:hypothetical protein